MPNADAEEEEDESTLTEAEKKLRALRKKMAEAVKL